VHQSTTACLFYMRFFYAHFIYIPFRRNIYSVLFSTAVRIWKCELFFLSVCRSVSPFLLYLYFDVVNRTKNRVSLPASQLHFISCSVRRVKFHWLHKGFYSGFREIRVPWEKRSVLHRAVLGNVSLHHVTWMESNLNQHKSNSSKLQRTESGS